MQLSRLLTVFAVLTCCSGASAQQILFSTLGEGESFLNMAGPILGAGIFWKFPENHGEVLAVPFTPAASALFSRADFALSAPGPHDVLTGSPDLDVTLAADDGGYPGGALEAIHIPNVFGGARAIALLSAPSSLHPALEAGHTYWLILAPTDLFRTAMFWLLGPSGAANQIPAGGILASESTLQPNWSRMITYPEQLRLAFAVFGGSDATDGRPTVAMGGVVSAASFATLVSNGSWVSIFGSNFASTARSWQISDFQGSALPVSLDGISVLVNGTTAAVSYAAPDQINAQFPDIDPSSPLITLQVITPHGASNPVAVQRYLVSPALFTLPENGIEYAAATLADGTRISPARPAIPGDVLAIYGTGFGKSNPAIAAGVLVSTPEPLADVLEISVTIGGIPSLVSYAGIVGAGLDQLNVTVPELSAGNQALMITIDRAPAQDGVVLPIGTR